MVNDQHLAKDRLAVRGLNGYTAVTTSYSRIVAML